MAAAAAAAAAAVEEEDEAPPPEDAADAPPVPVKNPERGDTFSTKKNLRMWPCINAEEG